MAFYPRLKDLTQADFHNTSVDYISERTDTI